MSEDEQFVRSIYPNVSIGIWYTDAGGQHFGLYSEYGTYEMSDTWLAYWEGDDMEQSWKDAKERILRQMMLRLEQ
jgi:hypothetical protein